MNGYRVAMRRVRSPFFLTTSKTETVPGRARQEGRGGRHAERASGSRGLPEGFTLVELLVVITIIGILLAIMIPAIQAVRRAAQAATCRNNLRQLAMGVDLFYGAQRHYPQGQFLQPAGKRFKSASWSWTARILPFIEEKTIYESGRIPTSTLEASGVAAMPITLLRCPSDGVSGDGPNKDRGNLLGYSVALTNYKGCMGANWGADDSLKKTAIGTDWENSGTNGSRDGLDHGDGIMYRCDSGGPRRKSDVTDGLSKTFMLGEDIPKADIYCSWPYSNNAYSTCAMPPNVNPRPGSNYSSAYWQNVQGFRSAHSGGVNFALCDGSVLFVVDEIELTIYHALATIQGHESVDPSPWMK